MLPHCLSSSFCASFALHIDVKTRGLRRTRLLCVTVPCPLPMGRNGARVVPGRRGISIRYHHAVPIDLHKRADTTHHGLFIALQVKDRFTGSVAAVMLLPRIQRPAVDEVKGQMGIKYAVERDSCS